MRIKMIHFGTLAVALLTASTAMAQLFSQNAADYNLGYGQTYGSDTMGYQPMGRDANGNRVIINGIILQGGDLSTITGAGYMSDNTSLFGGSPLAIGNSLNVITQGSWNTVIIDSTQINTGDITAVGQ